MFLGANQTSATCFDADVIDMQLDDKSVTQTMVGILRHRAISQGNRAEMKLRGGSLVGKSMRKDKIKYLDSN